MHKKILTTALVGMLAAATAAQADDAKAAGKEKCYGITKAGKNDCASKIGGNSCAGLTTKDGQGYLILPTGACDKIVGGKVMEEK